MTILELEQLTGLERSAIRYYEKKGLLVAARQENSYRDYSIENANEIFKIKLLRQLDIPIEQILRLQQGSTIMSQVLERQAMLLSADVANTEHTATICREISETQVSYAELDAQRFLTRLNDRAQSQADQTEPNTQNIPVNSEPAQQQHETIKTEWIQYEFHPVRRFVARILDYAIVRIMLRFLLIVVFRVRPFTDLLSNLIAYGSLFLSIPLHAWFLHNFATTPGKWLMGIRIVAVDGRHLTFGDAMIREAKALCFGHGFGIPIISLICNARSYKLYSDRRCLPQDDSIEHLYNDCVSVRKKALLAGTCAVLVAMSVVCGIESVKPRHRGDLTIEEFAENYNFYCYVVNDSRSFAAARDPMGPDGKWNVGKPDDERNTVIISTTKGQSVDYVYTLEGEYLRGISYTNEWTEIQYWSIPDHLVITCLTVILSQDGLGYLDASEILTDLAAEMKDEQGQLTRENITIRWNIETEGCHGSDGEYIGKDGPEGTSIKLHYEIIIN